MPDIAALLPAALLHCCTAARLLRAYQCFTMPTPKSYATNHLMARNKQAQRISHLKSDGPQHAPAIQTELLAADVNTASGSPRMEVGVERGGEVTTPCSASLAPVKVPHAMRALLPTLPSNVKSNEEAEDLNVGDDEQDVEDAADAAEAAIVARMRFLKSEWQRHAREGECTLLFEEGGRTLEFDAVARMKAGAEVCRISSCETPVNSFPSPPKKKHHTCAARTRAHTHPTHALYTTTCTHAQICSRCSPSVGPLIRIVCVPFCIYNIYADMYPHARLVCGRPHCFLAGIRLRDVQGAQTFEASYFS